MDVVVCPCPPIHNDVVTPRHLFSLFLCFLPIRFAFSLARSPRRPTFYQNFVTCSGLHHPFSLGFLMFFPAFLPLELCLSSSFSASLSYVSLSVCLYIWRACIISGWALVVLHCIWRWLHIGGRGNREKSESCIHLASFTPNVNFNSISKFGCHPTFRGHQSEKKKRRFHSNWPLSIYFF